MFNSNLCINCPIFEKLKTQALQTNNSAADAAFDVLLAVQACFEQQKQSDCLQMQNKS